MASRDNDVRAIMQLNRRDLLKGTAGLGAAAAFGTASGLTTNIKTTSKDKSRDTAVPPHRTRFISIPP